MIQLANGATLSGASNLPLVEFDQSIVSTGGSLLRVTDPGSEVTLSGPLLKATGYSLLNLDRGALRILNGGSLISNGAGTLMQFDYGHVNTISQFVDVEGTGSKLSLSGPLVSATNSYFMLGPNLALDSQFLAFKEGAQITSSGAAPLISFTEAEF